MYVCRYVLCAQCTSSPVIILQEYHHIPCALVIIYITYILHIYVAAAQGEDQGPSFSSLMGADHVTVSEDEEDQDCLVEDLLDRLSSVVDFHMTQPLSLRLFHLVVLVSSILLL